MRARLRWRLLVVPRMLLALGVLVWAVLNVLTARRPRRPSRRPVSGADPVGDALADARPVPRHATEDLDVADLRRLIGVSELDEDGFDTVVQLADEIASYVDLAEDGLGDALADRPGIDAVRHADREVLLVRSALALPDVHAAAVRAVLDVNRAPRRVPRLRALSPTVMAEATGRVAALLRDSGFDADLHRVAGDRLVQAVRLRDGIGYHHDDGTVTDARLRLVVEIIDTTGAAEPAEATEAAGAERALPAGQRILSASYDATLDDLPRIVPGKVLPLCAATTSRAAIADRWISGLPWHVPDRVRWEAADIAARWGFRGHARDLLRHGARNSPEAAVVAARHGL